MIHSLFGKENMAKFLNSLSIVKHYNLII